MTKNLLLGWELNRIAAFKVASKSDLFPSLSIDQEACLSRQALNKIAMFQVTYISESDGSNDPLSRQAALMDALVSVQEELDLVSTLPLASVERHSLTILFPDMAVDSLKIKQAYL